jgi:hypothetical protein
MKMSIAKRLEIRTTIKFCASIGKTPTDTYIKLKIPVYCHNGWFINGAIAL